jgi:hypothetical protein
MYLDMVLCTLNGGSTGQDTPQVLLRNPNKRSLGQDRLLRSDLATRQDHATLYGDETLVHNLYYGMNPDSGFETGKYNQVQALPPQQVFGVQRAII